MLTRYKKGEIFYFEAKLPVFKTQLPRKKRLSFPENQSDFFSNPISDLPLSKNMWVPAIEAIKTDNLSWIENNRKTFVHFFSEENLESRGKLNSKALEYHYRERLFKIFLSRDYDGLELPLDIGSKWIENAAALESNWGWLLAIGVGGAYFANFMPEEIAKKYFSPENALVAGSGKPSGEALKIPGGNWQVKGYWSYCSGSEQASLFTAVALKENVPTAFILPVENGKIHRDWNAIGLPLTCSHSISAKAAKIPEDYFFNLGSTPRKSGYPLGKYPFLLFALSCFVPVIVGISRAFWMETGDYLKKKESLWQQYQIERWKYISKKQRYFLEEQEILKRKFYALQENSWRSLLKNEDIGEKELGAQGLKLAEFCFNSCGSVMPELGMEVLDKSNSVQRLWQDLQTAFQHMIFHQFQK